VKRVLIALGLCLALPATADAVPITIHKQVPDRELNYERVGSDAFLEWEYGTKTVERVVHRPPADVDDDGVSDSEDPCIGPCPAPQPEPTETVSAAPVASEGGCPSYMAGEASSPTDVNPTSDAAGCYQVIPSTAAAMGAACADVNAPSCVAAICAAQGNAAWDAAAPC
jgi:hypothetical protein